MLKFYSEIYQNIKTLRINLIRTVTQTRQPDVEPLECALYDGMRETEKEVAKFLYELKLYWVYQSPVFVYDSGKRPRVWAPDFYLPDLSMYLEVWNSDRSHEYRESVYRKNGHLVIFVHVQKENWKDFLVKRIMFLEDKRHTEIEKMLKSLVFK